MAGIGLSLLVTVFLAWVVTYVFIDGSEPENPGTDPGAGIAFMALVLLFAPAAAAIGGVLAARVAFRRKGSP